MMAERVSATPAALKLIDELTAQYGPIIFCNLVVVVKEAAHFQCLPMNFTRAHRM